MAHTVIGFFKNSSDANNALDVLRTKGFDNSNIDVSSGYGNYENEDERKEKGSKVGNFFRSLFGDDDNNNTTRYSEVARNNTMITVHAFSEEEAERAADILDDCGAIDVDEKGYTDSDTDYASRGTYASGTLADNDEYANRDTTYASDRLTDDDDYSSRDTTYANENLADNDDFSRRDTTYASDRLTDDDDYNRRVSDRDFDKNKESSIPIIEEQVSIGKREVRRGGVRVRSRIIERPVEETLRLREERVHVERNPVDRAATQADLDNFREETIEINEYAEEPIISKTARVVEEIKVGKEVEERSETVRDTERKTEVDVENLEKNRLNKDKDF